MSKSPELEAKRNQRIKERYEVLSAKKIGTKQMYRNDAILEMLSNEFYLTPHWILKIISDKNKPLKKEANDPDQINMFEE